MVANCIDSKVFALEELSKILQEEKLLGKKIVHCHGVFDLLHPGHIRHFRKAKELGDILVVTVTEDRYVNKGPGRPAFSHQLRMESIAALQFVDYVALSPTSDAVACIKKVNPDFYVKGKEYENAASDVTGKISAEAAAVKENKGQIFFTDDIVFSSSSLLNRYFDPLPNGAQKFIHSFKEKYSLDQCIEMVSGFENLRVLIIGDAIIDQYQYVFPLGLSGKGLHMSARCTNDEIFLGGSLIIANHIGQFCKNVTLLTALGKNCPHKKFVQQHLSAIDTQFFTSSLENTLIKKRYVLKDGQTLSKLFETYSSNDPVLEREETEKIIDYLKQNYKNFDLILVSDFGNGFTNTRLIDTICSLPNFLAVNTQTNSGNRGYNVITHYKRANYISLNGPELRLAAHNRESTYEAIAYDFIEIMQADVISVTKGVDGVLTCNKNESISIPAFSNASIDRVGAGDCFLALSSLALAKKYPADVAAFFGSIAAAMSVRTIGNAEFIGRVPFYKYLTRLMK